MRALSALPQCGQVTPSGQRIASKYERALRSSVKMGSERFKDIGKPHLSEAHPTSCAPFVKVIIPAFCVRIPCLSNAQHNAESLDRARQYRRGLIRAKISPRSGNTIISCICNAPTKHYELKIYRS